MNLASVAEPAVASSHRGGRNQLKPRYTPVEDRMMLQAIEIHGRNWHNVLKVLTDHHEVLGEEIGRKYKDVDPEDQDVRQRR